MHSAFLSGSLAARRRDTAAGKEHRSDYDLNRAGQFVVGKQIIEKSVKNAACGGVDRESRDYLANAPHPTDVINDKPLLANSFFRLKRVLRAFPIYTAENKNVAEQFKN
jgi:hypothetical protein